jgi:hypothetical protein
MTSVVLLSGSSGGDALGSIGRSFRPLFESRGFEFIDINFAGTGNAVALLQEVIQTRKIEFAFSYMSFASDLASKNSEGKTGNLWESLKAPFLSLYGDSPAYFFDRHVAPSANFGCMYWYPEHLALRNRLPKNPGICGAVPPVVLDVADDDALDFAAKTQGDLLFLKNGNDPEALRALWMNVLQPRPLKAILELADHFAADLAGDAANQIDDVVTAYFLSAGVDIGPLTKLRLFFIAQLDDYIRRLKSTMMGKTLMDFPVQIHGVNWEHLDFSGGRAKFVAECDFVKSRMMIRESLGVLDMSPNIGQAPHDRVLRAFGSQTFCLTNEQEFVRRDVPEPAAMSFRFEPESLRERVADVLAHPARHVEIGRENAKAYRAKYKPQAGIDYLIDTAELIRLNQLTERQPDMPPYFVWPPKSLG